ncbi:MAG: hypothetical protein ACJAQW_001909, partial [Paracoccaceae bacterium]
NLCSVRQDIVLLCMCASRALTLGKKFLSI